MYLATLGGARTLDLEGTIGNFEAGCEADFIVMDCSATSFLKFRIQHAKTLHEKLFAMMMLGDDRCVEQTYIMGKSVYKRDDNNQFSDTRSPVLEEA